MYKCKNCGGDLVLNIANQQLKCPFCDSVFPVSDYEDAGEIAKKETYEATIYTCSQCGAEIMTTDSTAVTFCSYCGTEANLQGRLSKEKKPKYIIPFKKTKEQCKSIYSLNAKKEPYAPKEFTDPEFLEKFRGIYIPYWELNVGFDKDPELKVTERYTSGSYDYTDEYSATPKLRGIKIPVPQDASASFDDEMSAEIAPFNKEDMVSFNPAYMAGFFADTADVDASVYEEKALAIAEDHIVKNVTSNFRSGATVSLPSGLEARSKIFGSRIVESHLNLFPVWFLTWRKGDRLAYGIINGDTGKLSAEVPIDIRQFFTVSAVIGVILFIISSITSVLFLPATVLMISSVASLIVHYMYRQEVISIADRENHVNDLGSLDADALRKAKDTIKEKGVRKKSRFSTTSLVVAVIVILGLMFLFDAAAVRAVIICFITSLKSAADVKEGSIRLLSLLPLLAELIAFVVAFMTPVQDWIYYAGSILALIVSGIVCVNMIRQYNLLTTRPIPEFHNREGGSKDVGR